MLNPNNLQIVKYIPLKPLYLFGISGTLISIIFSYLNMNNVTSYLPILSTYYNIQLHTNELVNPNNLELIKVLNHNIYKQKYEYRLREVIKLNKHLNNLNILDCMNHYEILRILYTNIRNKLDQLQDDITYFLINILANQNITFLKIENKQRLNFLCNSYQEITERYDYLWLQQEKTEKILKEYSVLIDNILILVDNIRYKYKDYIRLDINDILDSTEVKYIDIGSKLLHLL